MTETASMAAESIRRFALGGVAVAIVRKGRPPEYFSAGLADRATGRPVETGTVFRIASISKTMTAVGLMQLRDQGLFDLDDPVNDYLSTLRLVPPAGGPAVTFRHLLTHTAGIGEMPRVADAWHREVWGLGPPGTAAADVGSLYGGTFRTEVPAGSKWAYANHGFVVLGQLVQDISGVPFAEYMQERIFGPLKMPHTEYLRSERTAAQVATGYHWILGTLRAVKDYDLTVLGAGSVLSSLSDMATYATWLAAGSTARSGVLAASTKSEMMSPHYALDPRLPGQGLAFFLSQFAEHNVVGHDGNIPGFASCVLAVPSQGLGVVVLTNTATLYGANRLAAMVLRSLLDVPDPVAQLSSSTVVAQPHVWADLVGCYAPSPGLLTNARSWQMLGGEVQVVISERQLCLQALSPVKQMRKGFVLHATHPEDPLRFAFEFKGAAIPLVFERSGSDQVNRLIIGRPVQAVLTRRPRLRSSRLRLRVIAGLAALATLRRMGQKLRSRQ